MKIGKLDAQRLRKNISNRIAEDIRQQRVGRMLQNKGFVDGKQLLRPELLEEMSSAQLPEELMSETVNQGLGVRVITGDTYPWLPVGSFGWSGAYGTHFWVDPVNGITAVYMKNSRYDGGSGAITAKHFEEDVFLALIDN